MDAFLPSEIARLVLGYLKEEHCIKTYETFIEENSSLQEYFTLYKKGIIYPTNVNEYSLLDILNEYRDLKRSRNILSTDSCSKVCEFPNSNNYGNYIVNTSTHPNCDEDKTANQKAKDNVQQNTQINELRDVIDLSNNSNAETLQTKSITEETDTNDQSRNLESEPNSYTQVAFVDSGAFIQSPVDEMQFSYPQNYIWDKYSSNNTNGLYSQSPYYAVFNTPSASSGTIPTTPILSAPNITANNYSSYVIATEEDKIPFIPIDWFPRNEIAITSVVGAPESLKEKYILDTKIEERVLKTSVRRTNSKKSQKVSKGRNSRDKKGMKKEIKKSLVAENLLIPTPKAGISSLLDHKREYSSKVSKGKNSRTKMGMKKEIKGSSVPQDQLPAPKDTTGPVTSIISSLLDHKKENSRKGKFKISSNSPSKGQKATQGKYKRKKDEKCKKKSDKDKLKVKIVNPKPKNSSLQSVYNEKPFPEHKVKYDLDPSNKIAKCIHGPKNGTKAVSPFPISHSNFNNSTVMKSSFSDVKEDRVLKVVLSDIFKGKFSKK